MNEGTARAGLQILLSILGSVAVLAGVSTLILGAESIVGVEDPSPAVDSEMRFFAAWYAAAGVLVLRAVPRIETQRNVIRGIAVLLFIAGCSRALSWIMVGKPPPLALALMVVELTLPFVIVPWQATVTARSQEQG